MFHRPRPEEQESEKKTIDQQKTAEARRPEQVAQARPVAEKNDDIIYAKEEKNMNYSQADNREEKEEQANEAPAGAPFQRPPQMQRSVPGFAGGSYPGASSHAHGYEGRGHNGERRLVIGQGITMSGEIEACDYLLVEGTLEAALKGAKVLDIAECGVFYGSVEIEEATVAGRFEGELTVNGRLTIKSGGSVTGAVAYKELAVEAGATLDGKISPLASKAAAASGSPKKPMAPKNDNGGSAVEGSELPFSGNAAAAAE